MEPNSNKNNPSSLFPLETCPPISDEAFNLFHNIDRELYTRLIHIMGRDPAESMQVMAFWIWIERQGTDSNLIRRMLSLPPVLLNELAEEAVTCLKVAENDVFPFVGDSIHEITLLPDLLSNRVVSLRFFHENRIAVLRGVSKVVASVCARAFRDIGVPESSRMAAERRNNNEGGININPPVLPHHVLYHPNYYNVPFLPLPGGLMRIPLPPPQLGVAPPPMAVVDAAGNPIHVVEVPIYDMGAQRQMLGDELGELLTQNLTIRREGEEEGEEIAPDDRTIFLTFSKGYPITEDEVREFFTRRFGDFIEELIMQEVEGDEQVLYARMVARSTAVINGIVGGNRAKYSINGKHVWARKYVKKQNSRSPPRDGESS